MPDSNLPNLFVIQNGTQLLNAIEFIYSRSLVNRENHLLIVSISHVIVGEMQRILQKVNFFSQTTIMLPDRILRLSSTHFNIVLKTIIGGYKLNRQKDLRCNNLIIGNYRNAFCLFIVKNTRSKTVSLLDDGPSTMELDQKWRNKLSGMHKLVHKLLGVFEYNLLPNEIFTTYADYFSGKELGCSIEKNEYHFVKSQLTEKIRTDSVFFVGYPMVQERLVTIENYVKLLRLIKEKTGDYVYIPHRREGKEVLDEISKYFEVKKLGLPFEMFLFASDDYPREIRGFFSSVFFNVNTIAGKLIKLSYVHLRNFKVTHFSNLESIYSRLSKIANENLSIDMKEYLIKQVI